jgi:hypothetical protein
MREMLIALVTRLGLLRIEKPGRVIIAAGLRAP